MTDTPQLQRAWSLFDRLVDLPPEQRRQALEAEAPDPALAGEVEALLRDYEQADAASDALPEPVPPQLAAGTVVGGWQVAGLLGRGGMGEVYLVERHADDYEQRAALKLVPEMASPEDRARFASERGLLARFEHPLIARLLDGGEHAGMPYAVMEYVDGVPLTEYARGLSLRQRVGLLLQACTAVGYAHRHLVIHRDLKPGNMLVTAGGELKLLDFGIAKRIAAGPQHGDQATTVIRASPDYCAPEQLSGAPISTATDVYALGVIAFELLADERPWKLGGLPVIRAMERLASQEPPRPSARLAGARRKQVQGDLDSIVLKAMQPDPEHRYVTVNALADDLRAWLEQRPVTARHGSWHYTLARMVQRHKLPVALAAAVLLSLSLGLVGVSWQARQAALERDIALREVERNQAVRHYLALMFRTAGELQGSDDVTAREVLDRTADRLHDTFAGQPDTYAEVSLMLAQLYLSLNDYAGARPLLARLLEAPQVPEAQQAMARHDLAQLVFRANTDPSEAEPLLQQAQAFWASDPQRYRSELLDSRLLQSQLESISGDPDTALLTLTDSLPQRIQLSGQHHRETAVLINNIGNAYFRLGRFEEAADQFRQADAVWHALGQTRTPDALNTLNNWASAEYRLDRPGQAVKLFKQALELRQELYGPSMAMAALLNNLGKTLVQLQRPGEAIGYLQEAIDMAARHAGDATSMIGISAGMGLMDAHSLSGNTDQARAVLEWLEPDLQAGPGPEHPLAVMLKISRARLLHAEGDSLLARVELEKARSRIDTMGPGASSALAQLETVEATIGGAGR